MLGIRVLHKGYRPYLVSTPSIGIARARINTDKRFPNLSFCSDNPSIGLPNAQFLDSRSFDLDLPDLNIPCVNT